MSFAASGESAAHTGLLITLGKRTESEGESVEDKGDEQSSTKQEETKELHGQTTHSNPHGDTWRGEGRRWTTQCSLPGLCVLFNTSMLKYQP